MMDSRFAYLGNDGFPRPVYRGKDGFPFRPSVYAYAYAPIRAGFGIILSGGSRWSAIQCRARGKGPDHAGCCCTVPYGKVINDLMYACMII